jgi:hypothetical protein
MEIESKVEFIVISWSFTGAVLSSSDHHELMRRGMIEPLFRTLRAQEDRLAVYKAAFKDLEQAYLLRLTPKERDSYQPKVIDTEAGMWSHILKTQVSHNDTRLRYQILQLT